MIDSNIEVLRSLYDAIAVGNLAKVLTLIDHERLEIREPESLPYGGIYRGVEGFTQCASKLANCWVNVTFRDLSFTASSTEEAVIASFTLMATARPTGMKVSFAVIELVRFANGKIIMIKPFYWDTHALRKLLALTD